ncbi:TetR/AcrR family transcriptional regulator [Brevundimonas goettingensis]|uniref:TetR/AcrR family transcriptional regulator n=1 Tax=Brevundimonas goettingensis TaxID=2774190 RepID=A0A975BY91_9CAUL|nr:TetR/AcrR family transcriptional regulator [Brevundimonas goettingensis]QTC89686.1 TetR/AcrR family transcriptional regulator [Brevundimonas goettingensis]
MTRTGAATRQTERYEAKRDAILNAAARLFNRKGLKGATLADVAEAVGLITTSVTYYYRRKEDLAAACLLRTIDLLNGLVETASAAPTPEARVTAFIDAYFEVLADIATHRRPEPINFYDIRALTGPQVMTVKDAFNDLFRAIRALLRPEAGSPFDRLEENARTHLFFSQILWARTWLRRYDPDDYPRVARRMAVLILEGMAEEGAVWHGAEGPAVDPDPPVDGEISQASYLKAVTQLVNDQGYHGASVERIAAKLNVTKGSFYHHNDTKDDLVASCFERSFAIVRGAQKQAVGETGWDRITSVTDALARFQLSPNGPLLQYMALAAAPGGIRGDLLAAMDRLSKHFAGEVSDGIADGSIRRIDPAVAAQLITGAVNAAADLPRWIKGKQYPAAIDTDWASQTFVRPLFTGLLCA